MFQSERARRGYLCDQNHGEASNVKNKKRVLRGSKSKKPGLRGRHKRLVES